MNRLQQHFSDRVDFFHIDSDRSDTQEVRRQFNIRRRSTYVLIDAGGNVLRTWMGPLREDKVLSEIEETLADVSG